MALLTSLAPLPLTMISGTLALLFPKHTTLIPTPGPLHLPVPLPGIPCPSFLYDLLALILWVPISLLQRSFLALSPKLLTCHPYHNTWSFCTALALGQWFTKGTLGGVWRCFLVVTIDGGGGATGIKWVKVRNETQHPAMPRTVPTTENDPPPGSAVLRGKLCIHYLGEKFELDP